MLKVLIKKQIQQMLSGFFVDRKGKYKPSKGKMAGSIALLLFLFVCLSMAFVSFCMIVGPALFDAEMDWLYFSIFATMGIVIGTFLSMFSTSSALYNARDNELLLSLPIPMRTILVSRILGTIGTALAYSAMIWLPAIGVHIVVGTGNFKTAIFGLLVWLASSLLVAVLGCIFGAVVAVISSKIRNKAIVTSGMMFIIIGIYYVFNFKIQKVLFNIAENYEGAASFITNYLAITQRAGLATAGDVKSLLYYIAVAVVAFALCILVLSRSFKRIISANHDAAKIKHVDTSVKETSKAKSLLKKELKKYTSSTVYLMNTAIGYVILLAGSVFAFIKSSVIREALLSEGAPAFIKSGMAIIVVAALWMILAMSSTTPESISIEGPTMWIMKSLPIKTKDILDAKLSMHVRIAVIPTILATLALGYSCGIDMNMLPLMIVLNLLFAGVWGQFGLFLNLKHINLNWVNEAAVVKQGLPVTISMFGGWIAAAIYAGGFFLLKGKVAVDIYMTAGIVLLLVISYIFRNWLKTKGVLAFEEAE